MRKLISFMYISLDGFVAGPNREMDWIKVDEVPKVRRTPSEDAFGKIFHHVVKRISQGDTVPIAGCSLSLPIAIGTGEVLRDKCDLNFGVE